MFDYARSDTHFLLYIYDNMRNELIEKSILSQFDGNLIDQVLRKSKEEAVQRYERPLYDTERGTGAMGWYSMLSRTPALFNRQQFAVFRAVHRWRDTVARQKDESVHHILSKQALFNIAREMPQNKASLLGCSYPISKELQAHAGDLIGVIGKAKATGADGPDLKELMQDQGSTHAKQELKATGAEDAGSASVSAAGKVVSSPEIPNSKLPIRINHSQFWGSTMGSTAWHIQNLGVQTQQGSLRLALPLPRLTAQIFNDKMPVAVRSFPVEPGVCAEHRFIKDRKPKEDNVFIVKQLGGPRKRKASEPQDAPEPAVAGVDSPAMNGTSESLNNELAISLDDDHGEQVFREKAKRKAQRKAQKKLEKQQRKAEKLQQVKDGGGGEGQGEVEAFDYANAPSVLHAKRDNNDRTGRTKSFDPYAKSLDAPKGMRKSKKEIAGKSFTFKK